MTIMTQGPGIAPAKSVAPTIKTRRWWWRAGVAPLMLLVAAFVAFAVPPYLTFDPSQSRIPPPEGFAPYYPLLVAHVIFGTVAILACCFQIWPWFRVRYPAAHRAIGRVYVFGGVVPAGLLGLVIGANGPFGLVLRVSNMLLAVLWVGVTVAGFLTARRRRYVEHRRWMIRSFVLTLSIITNRVWAAVGFLVVVPQMAGMFEGNETLMVHTIAGLTGWLGWVVPLLVAEWWLERDVAVRRVHSR